MIGLAAVLGLVLTASTAAAADPCSDAGRMSHPCVAMTVEQCRDTALQAVRAAMPARQVCWALRREDLDHPFWLSGRQAARLTAFQVVEWGPAGVHVSLGDPGVLSPSSGVLVLVDCNGRAYVLAGGPDPEGEYSRLVHDLPLAIPSELLELLFDDRSRLVGTLQQQVSSSTEARYRIERGLRQSLSPKEARGAYRRWLRSARTGLVRIHQAREVSGGVPIVIGSWRLVPRCLLAEVHEVWPDGRVEQVSSSPVGECPIGPTPQHAPPSY